MRAAMVSRFGGPEVFEVVRRPDLVPGAGQVTIDVTAHHDLTKSAPPPCGRGADFVRLVWLLR
jgi:NADPH2:quinone reductase